MKKADYNQVLKDAITSIEANSGKLDQTRKFYVYALLDPRKPGVFKYRVGNTKQFVEFSFQPFYVGKGFRDRVSTHEREARNSKKRNHKLNTLRAILEAGMEVIVLKGAADQTEAEALAKERLMIQAIGRVELGTGPLTNATDGGDGGSAGKIFSEAERARVSKQFKGIPKSAEHVRRILDGRRNYVPSDETRALWSSQRKGRAVTGAQVSAMQEGRLRWLADLKAKGLPVPKSTKPRPPISEETREKMRLAKLGKKRSPEFGEAIRAGHAKNKATRTSK